MMMQFEKQPLPTAFARAVHVDSTFSYIGSLMTFLAKGSVDGRTLRPYMTLQGRVTEGLA
jgi:hypothetical protein